MHCMAICENFREFLWKPFKEAKATPAQESANGGVEKDFLSCVYCHKHFPCNLASIESIWWAYLVSLCRDSFLLFCLQDVEWAISILSSREAKTRIHSQSDPFFRHPTPFHKWRPGSVSAKIRSCVGYRVWRIHGPSRLVSTFVCRY